jgi:50S ribosomal protein L16 3-hydroxylase
MDWELEAGDILYLPPNFAHNGRALNDECMTYSIGFRAPSIQDALTGIRDTLCENVNVKDRFAAPETGKREHSAEIHADDITYLQAQLNRLISQPDLLANWLGETMSESKYPEYLAPLNNQEQDVTFQNAVKGQTFVRPGDARICYYQLENKDSIRVFCNGESIDITAELTSFVHAITDQVEFDFSGLDLTQNSDLEPLVRFFIRQQGIIELMAPEE